ncbi:hypothetical protein SS50377_25495 [Spironucleus salmonicida]|uniref:Uncharacterized protein n=1 Tax=Spironucleus salmonicida TaxID=348837 RepID=V6LKE7_9EUKA|nr:hypothetical protein SS50377_25495 [Spironucleus salmonicida]|eukprot:EST45042.1 Hypothetical protein SS50377_15061 [Spironucleus salmonicida]
MQVPFTHPTDLSAPISYNSLYNLPQAIKDLKDKTSVQSHFNKRIEFEQSIRPILAQQLALELDLASHSQTQVLTHSQKILLGYDNYICDTYFSRARAPTRTLEDIIREKDSSMVL